TLFRETWKRRRTPLRRPYWEHTALAPRTSGKGCTLSHTPTPAAQEPGGTQEMFLARRRKAAAKGIQIGKTSQGHLSHVAELAAVPTPNAMEGGQTSRGGKRKGELLMGGIVQLATVPTPMAGSPATETYNAAGNNDYSRKIVELATV